MRLILPVIVLLCINLVAALPLQTYLDAIQYPVVDTINSQQGDLLWVPWFTRDDVCSVNDLHSGSSCNSGQQIDFLHNCMVSDEFSQVGILYAYGDDPATFERFYNTVLAIRSSNGVIPAWRIYRDNELISACRSGVNSNCDTASDATARIIIALYAGAQTFSNATYADLADKLAQDHIKYETVKVSYLVSGNDITYWLAAGAGSASGGRSSTDFGYTGYFPDAILAMQQACAHTGNQTFCDAAIDYQEQYLLAAGWDGTHFTTPPGRSWKWVGTTAVCTNTCSPTQWDSADAPRALAMCGLSNLTSDMQAYCAAWRQIMSPTNTPIQFAPDGSITNRQSSYFAQGLAAQFYKNDAENFSTAVTSALNHYGNGVWDNQQCFGIYGKAFSLRALAENTTTVQMIQTDIINNDTINDTINETINKTLNDVINDTNESSVIDGVVLFGFDGPSFEPQQNEQQQEVHHSYMSTYNKEDLQPIVTDGVATFGAAVVENIDLLILSLILSGIVIILHNFKRW